MQFCVEGYYMCNFVSNCSPNSVALQVAKKLPHVTALLLVHQQLLLNSCYGKGVLRRVGSNTEVFLHLGNDFGGKADLGPIALFTVTFSHLQYNGFEHGCEAISGNFALFA